ncbi:lipase family protein [Nocardia altamirensis]|uniref:lipase family protein n=1 Tax=Nocardia altamirensis TaxID=472158 RepID=UPI0008408239|nr:lipase family protein [Nocardia altamirensis]
MRFALTVVAAAVLSLTGASAHAQPPAPGTVVESTPLSATELIPNAGTGFRVVHRTTGQSGQPEVSGGMVYVPAGTPPAGGWPVVSWGHGTSGMVQGCAPSLTDNIIGGTVDQALDLSRFLGAGYAVAASDYIGLGAPGYHDYLGGRAAGHAVIDIVRAARTLVPELSAAYVTSGLSQGGHAALFAGAMATEYAPELDLRGVLAFAPASNVERLIGLMGPTTPVIPLVNGIMTNGVLAIAGLAHARPDVPIADFLTARGREAVRVAETSTDCWDSVQRMVRGRPPGELLAKPLADPVFEAALRDYIVIPATGYRVPIRIAQGVLDDIMPLPAALILQQQLAHGGTQADLRVYPTATHNSIVSVAGPDALDFLRQTFG